MPEVILKFFLWEVIMFGLFAAKSMFVVMYLLAPFLAIGVFFFVATRGALIYRDWFRVPENPTSHVYPIYSEMWLIKFVDFQPIISAILLFQYEKLVDRIVKEIGQTVLNGKRVLITSCAFGNVIPNVVSASVDQGAKRVIITDLVLNELIRAEGKLGAYAEKVKLAEDDATCLKQQDGSVEVNVMFFLLHELPHHLKDVALCEAGRVLSSGGKLVLAEFHRPDVLLLRILSRVYFKVFEPYGLALWDSHDPVLCLERSGVWTCTRETYFFGNFQVIVATKK